MNEEKPEQGRRRRFLFWLLPFLACLLLVELGVGMGWLLFGASPSEAHATDGVAHVTRIVTNPRELTVSTAVAGRLEPGRPRPLVITIGNTGTHPVRVTSVNVVTGQPSASACRASWYAVTGQLPSRLVVGVRSTTQLTWQMLLRDLPHHNQDACKGASLSFTVRVQAVEAPA
jgi:hypothetical protein